jgi:hypothetical protein
VNIDHLARQARDKRKGRLRKRHFTQAAKALEYFRLVYKSRVIYEESDILNTMPPDMKLGEREKPPDKTINQREKPPDKTINYLGSSPPWVVGPLISQPPRL